MKSSGRIDEARAVRARALARLHAFRGRSDEPPSRARSGSGEDGRPVSGRRARAMRGQADRDLADRVAALEQAVEENRMLNQRLSDVVDVVTELLVPAVDRDDERLRAALRELDRTLGDSAGTPRDQRPGDA